MFPFICWLIYTLISVHLFINLSICFHSFVHLYIHLFSFICSLIYTLVFINLFIDLYTCFHSFVHQSDHMFPFICSLIYTLVSIHLFINLSIYFHSIVHWFEYLFSFIYMGVFTNCRRVYLVLPTAMRIRVCSQKEYRNCTRSSTSGVEYLWGEITYRETVNKSKR